MKEKGKRKKEEKNILRNLANLEFVAKCPVFSLSHLAKIALKKEGNIK